MIAGAGGAMRATGWRATAIRFQQLGEGAALTALCSHFPCARGAPHELLAQQLGGAARATGWRATAIGGNKAIGNPTALPKLCTKSLIPTNVYASAIGLCNDSIITQSSKPSNSDF